MGAIKNFIDELAKHKLLVYFVFLWGAMLFLWTLYGIIEWGFEISGVLGVLDLLYHLSELFAGLLLMLVGIKLMMPNILAAIKTEKMAIYFLLLWAGSFFFGGLWDIVDSGPWLFEYWNEWLAVLGGLASLFAGVALALFCWKMLTAGDGQQS